MASNLLLGEKATEPTPRSSAKRRKGLWVARSQTPTSPLVVHHPAPAASTLPSGDTATLHTTLGSAGASFALASHAILWSWWPDPNSKTTDAQPSTAGTMKKTIATRKEEETNGSQKA